MRPLLVLSVASSGIGAEMIFLHNITLPNLLDEATMAMMILGALLSLSGALAAATLYIFEQTSGEEFKKQNLFGAAVPTLLGAMFSIIGLAIWDLSDSMNYYTTMNALGATLTLIGGVCIIGDYATCDGSVSVSPDNAEQGGGGGGGTGNAQSNPGFTAEATAESTQGTNGVTGEGNEPVPGYE